VPVHPWCAAARPKAGRGSLGTGASGSLMMAPADRGIGGAPTAARSCGSPTTARHMHIMARRCGGEGEGAAVELALPAMVAMAMVACARASKNDEAEGGHVRASGKLGERLLPSHAREEEQAAKEHAAAMVGCTLAHGCHEGVSSDTWRVRTCSTSNPNFSIFG
jgi:hypothetical protein